MVYDLQKIISCHVLIKFKLMYFDVKHFIQV